ncbi:MAG: GerAB/ArcD/ProY family transporter [Desulfocucumaceae bacterium]
MSTFHFSILVAVFFIGTATMVVPVLGISQQDMWISSLIGWAIGTGYLLFLSFCKLPKGRHFLGRTLLCLYALYLAALTTRFLGEYMNMTVMHFTPLVVLNALLVALAAYAARQGINTIYKFCLFFFINHTLAEVILIGMALPIMKLEHLQPMFDQSLGTIMKDAIPFASFPFMEAVVLLPLLKMVNPRKGLLLGSLLGGGMLVAAVLAVLLILPPNRMQYFYAPAFSAIDSIPAGNFAKAIVMTIWLQTSFLKISLLLYIVSKQIETMLNINYQTVVLPIAVLITGLSMLIFDNIVEMFGFTFKAYPYFAISFQLAIPLYFIIAGWLANRTSLAKS